MTDAAHVVGTADEGFFRARVEDALRIRFVFHVLFLVTKIIGRTGRAGRARHFWDNSIFLTISDLKNALSFKPVETFKCAEVPISDTFIRDVQPMSKRESVRDVSVCDVYVLSGCASRERPARH